MRKKHSDHRLLSFAHTLLLLSRILRSSILSSERLVWTNDSGARHPFEVLRGTLFAGRYGGVVATPKVWTIGSRAADGRCYGTITTEKSYGKRPSRSAYSLVRIGITRQIEQLGMVLRGLITGLLGGRDPGEAAMATAQAEQALDEALQLQPGTIATLPATDLLQHLQHRPDCTEANLDLLADLLIALADAPNPDSD